MQYNLFKNNISNATYHACDKPIGDTIISWTISSQWRPCHSSHEISEWRPEISICFCLFGIFWATRHCGEWISGLREREREHSTWSQRVSLFPFHLTLILLCILPFSSPVGWTYQSVSGHYSDRTYTRTARSRCCHILLCTNPKWCFTAYYLYSLDTETIDALVEASQSFKGGLICVSHDQYFINSVCEVGSLTRYISRLLLCSCPSLNCCVMIVILLRSVVFCWV